ncbi:ATP-binding protein [Streptomyces sp. B6B3]|uniref:ATP-binding protein n=1 Tax=Streptomyces sp. B6B3 TaxID=3153570 RepID=UPI00325F7547
MKDRIGSRYPLSAGRAREITRGFLSVMTPPATRETAEMVALVVSELVTNAVRHAGGVTEFRLRVVPPDGVEILVGDASPRRPRRQTRRPAAAGGFGLELVDQLARSVSVRATPEGGKTVRAVVPVGAVGAAAEGSNEDRFGRVKDVRRETFTSSAQPERFSSRSG